MSRPRWEANLDVLCRGLDGYATANRFGTTGPPSATAARLSKSLYLAHSTADAKFADVCGNGRLFSSQRIAAERKKPLSTRCAGVLLGTADFVFFFAAPFRFPHTGCGLLFAASLESAHTDDGVAAPFDSGGLLKHLTWPNPAEPVLEFLLRHELPIPQHRRYLNMCMDVLFGRPEDYVEGTDPSLPGPIGLTGGDQRRWTHEVRIPEQVALRGSHLQAVFAPRARVAAEPKIERLFQWCASERVDWVVFDTPRRDDFEALWRMCLDYIRRTLY
jgi:hypothetical protein